MNYLCCLLTVTALSASFAKASLLIDDFNAYTNASYIQVQNPAWSRFGNATSDGIYSIAGGVDGTRGASYIVNWGAGSNGYVRYTFATAQDFSLMNAFTLDLSTNSVVAGTLAYLQINYTQTIGETTIVNTYETTMGLSLASTQYENFVFNFTPDSVTRREGMADFATVMANVTSFTFRYNNSTGAGNQQIRFDNFYAVPEPRALGLLFAASVLILSHGLRRRTGVCA